MGADFVWLNCWCHHRVWSKLSSDWCSWSFDRCLGCFLDNHGFVGRTKPQINPHKRANCRNSALVLAALFIVDPKTVVRDDGTHIAIFEKPTMKTEISGVLAVLKDPKIIILLPAMFVGEMCLALMSSINGMYNSVSLWHANVRPFIDLVLSILFQSTDSVAEQCFVPIHHDPHPTCSGLDNG